MQHIKKAPILALPFILAIFAFFFFRTGESTAESQFACLPTCSETDGRFFSLAGASLNTLGSPTMAVEFVAPAGAEMLHIDIFDGDTRGGTSGHWDIGTDPLTFTLFADPTGDGSGDSQVGQWSGVDMLDNDWFSIFVATGPEALTASGEYHYTMHISQSNPAGSSESNFKLRTSGVIMFLRPITFSFVGALRSNNDIPIIYPNFPDLTTSQYDGTWDLYIDVPENTSYLQIWDGDFDYGSGNCTFNDTDDVDTPNDILEDWMDGPGVRFEGVAFSSSSCLGKPGQKSTGSPPDDGLNSYFIRSPSIIYQLTDPNGNVYANNNPSGNSEWEQFRIESDPNVPADHYIDGDLPAGTYHIQVFGVDLSNLNAWHIDYNILAVDENGDPIPVPRAEPPGGQGCTPGYWKQPQHFDSWVHYQPGDSYDATFGITSSFGGTLLDAAGRGGGGEKALARHAVAALLNTTNNGVSFPYSPTDVINMVQSAYTTGNFEGVKDLLAAQNEMGCPLN